jgi:hypothetical protein
MWILKYENMTNVSVHHIILALSLFREDEFIRLTWLPLKEQPCKGERVVEWLLIILLCKNAPTLAHRNSLYG